MTEQLARQLGKDAQHALQLARRLAGKMPILKRVSSIPGDAHAMLIRPLHGRKPYEIHLARGQERNYDHLVTHEVGHLVRLHQVPEPERLLAVASAQERRRAIEQIGPELVTLLQDGFPEHALPELFDVWFRGVCTQLTSFPADLRIEQWIHDRYPGLRRIQERSLVDEVRRAIPLLRPEVVALTPTTIYRATMAMNAAQAVHVADLYHRPEITIPFALHGLVTVGAGLTHLALDPADEGHRSDVLATEAWARELQVAGWMEWRHPTDRLLSVEVPSR